MGSGKSGAEPAGCYADLTSEHLGQMALVGETGFLCNQGEQLGGLAQQTFGTLNPALDDITLPPNPSGLLERAAKVIGTQTRDVGQHAEGKVIVEMCLDVVSHPLQPLFSQDLAQGL